MERSERSRFSQFLFPLTVALAAAWWPPPAPGSPGPSGPVRGAGGEASAPAPGEQGDLAREEEEEGDRFRAKAEPAYRRALEAWEMARRFALRLGDSSGIERAVGQRAGLLALLLDSRSFEELRKSSTGAAPPAVPLPLTVPPPGPLPTGGTPRAAGASEEGEDLEALADFLRQAGRAYFRSSEKEARDLPLLFESLALAERLLADLHQARADDCYRRALAGGREPGAADPAAAARARLLYKLRDFEGARALLRGAALDEGLLAAEEKLRLIRVRRDLARFQGDRAEALALERRLSELGEKAEEVPLPSAPLMSFVAGRSADLIRAARTLESAAASRLLCERERTLALYLRGQSLLEAGEPAAAVEALEEARPRREAAGAASPPRDRWLEGGILGRLGEARDRSGDPEGAAAGYQEAILALAGLPGAERRLALLGLDAASALFALGQSEEARRAALAVLSTKGAPGDLRVRCRLLLASILYLSAGDSPSGLRDALSALNLAERERAESAMEKATGEELRALILAQTGNVQRKLWHLARVAADPARAGAALEEAVRSGESALSIAEVQGLGRLSAAIRANLGELQLESGDPRAARRSVSAALAAARSLHAFETEWRAHWCLARIAGADGDSAAGEREMEEAASIIEAHRGRILDIGRKVGFMARKVPLYEAMVERALDRGDGRRAFAAVERSRARSLVESLGLRFLLLAADRDRQVYREYVNLLSRVEEKALGEGQLFGLLATGSYDELREKLEGLKRRIRENRTLSPVLRALVEGEPASVEAVQGEVLEGERLLEYFGAGETVAAFVVGPRSFRALRLPAPRREIEERARRFAEGSAADRVLAAGLGRDLVEPLLEALEEEGPARSLIIVPFGELHRVPFEALSVRGRYLVETFAAAYLPAASVFRYLEKGSSERERPRRLLALVDPDTDYNGDGRADLPPLSGARAEVEGIAPLFPEREVLSGAQASELACARLAPGREVVHLACHGEFFPARPLDSRLYLSPGRPADGLLRASEIYGIDLRGSRLVALSGCETGRSAVAAGEDPVGIGAAFLQSGAGALLLSLWKVEDRATAELMKTFYRKWLEGGRSRASALREAKLALLGGGVHAAPRQWAPFILIGPR